MSLKEKNKTEHSFRDKGLKQRIFVYLIGFAIFLIALLWLFQCVFLDRFYKSVTVSELEKIATEIDSGLKTDSLPDSIQSIIEKNDCEIFITDKKGHILITENSVSEMFFSYMGTDDPKELIKNVLDSDEERIAVVTRNQDVVPKLKHINAKQINKLFGERTGTDHLVYAFRSEFNNEKVAVFIITALEPLQIISRTLIVQLSFVSVISIVLAVIIALWLSKQVSSPIEKLGKAARALETGNYNARFPYSESAYREINDLSKALNSAVEELSKVDRFKSDIIANISHDLRTPLTMIIGYGEIMKDLPGEKTEENIQIIIDEARFLTELVNDALDYSKFQSGTQVLTCEEFCLTDLIEEILLRYSKFREQDGYTIEFTSDAKACVCLDKIKISQAICNLVNNAINYAGPEKFILVRQTIRDDEVTIEVIDHGLGISKDQIDRIWERYSRPGENKRKIAGTGLGLAIVKSVFDLHGIQYGVESEIGKGSTFWFKSKLTK